ncbi:MAG: WD40/YVTN/BNR-like repeat-containing protein, partial [bacterium]
IGLTVSPKEPRILYAVVESDFGGSGREPFDNRSPSGGLFRTQDRGDTWTRINNLNFRPFYFSRVAVDPQDDKRVYLPGWDLAISDDGGRTFRASGSQAVHVDFHAIVVNPEDPRQILVGNDGGIYISHDRAESWDFRNNVAAGQFYRVAVDLSDPYRVGGGLQDNGSWMGPSETQFYTDDDGKDGILNDDWRPIFGGDGFGVAFDPVDPNIAYATAQGGELGRIRLDNNVMKLIKPSPREGQERFRFNWNAPFLISAHDPTVLYQGGNKVFKLTGRGDLWFAISGDLTRNEPGKTDTVGSDAETYGTVVSLAESPVQKGMLWAGTDDGRIHVT